MTARQSLESHPPGGGAPPNGCETPAYDPRIGQPRPAYCPPLNPLATKPELSTPTASSGVPLVRFGRLSPPPATYTQLQFLHPSVQVSLCRSRLFTSAIRPDTAAAASRCSTTASQFPLSSYPSSPCIV